MEKYILGVDGGGTKTAVIIADSEGNKIGEASAGSGNYKSVGASRAEKNIYRVIHKAANMAGLDKGKKFYRACFGMSGLDTPQDMKVYERIIFKSPIQSYVDRENTVICNDTKIGLLAGSSNPNAIMIICGTGSNCYGINSRGQEAKANGWDFIMGDEGSGFSIAAKALKAIMKSYDGRGPHTLLLEMVLKHLELEDAYSLIEWVYGQPLNTGRVASLASVVCAGARRGDSVCRKILAEEAGEAELSITTVAEKLGLRDEKFDLVFVGSVFNCELYFKNILQDNLKKRFGNINFVPLTREPVWGAIKLATKSC